MSDTLFGALMGSAITAAIALFGIFIAQQTGYLQIGIMRKQHDLNLLLATPKIGTDIRVDWRYDNGRAYSPFLYLTTTIQNEGELPVSQLNGKWKLSSPYGAREHIVPINRDFLGSSPYQLEPHRIDESGRTSESRHQIRFNVDIEFDYLSLPNNKPTRYTAKYQYDPESGQMIRIQEV